MAAIWRCDDGSPDDFDADNNEEMLDDTGAPSNFGLGRLWPGGGSPGARIG